MLTIGHGTVLATPHNIVESRHKTLVVARSRQSGTPFNSHSPHCGRLQSELPDPVGHDRIVCRPVHSRSDLMDAFRLLQQRYEATGLAEATPRGPIAGYIRMRPYHGWTQSQVFVATIQEQVVGTVTLILDGEFDLPMSEYFPREIRAARQKGKVCEIASLAVDPVHPKPTEVFGQLTRVLTFFARYHAMDSHVATVHPRHAKFYRHAMGFEIIGDEIQCQQVGGKPGVAVIGSVNDSTKYRKRWEDYYFTGSFPPDHMQARPMTSEEFRACQSVVDQQSLHAEICEAIGV